MILGSFTSRGPSGACSCTSVGSPKVRRKPPCCSCEAVDFESGAEILVSVSSLFIFILPVLEPECLVKTASKLLCCFTLQLWAGRKVTVSPQLIREYFFHCIFLFLLTPLLTCLTSFFFSCLVSFNSVPSLSLSISGFHLRVPPCLTCFYASFVAWLRRGILIVWDLLDV